MRTIMYGVYFLHSKGSLHLSGERAKKGLREPSCLWFSAHVRLGEKTRRERLGIGRGRGQVVDCSI